MGEQNIQEFEWVSEEVEKLYKFVNKVFTVIMINRFPYIKRIEIDKKTFNDVFAEEKPHYLNDVDVYVCAEYSSKEYYDEKQREKELETGGIGTTLGSVFKDSLLLMGNRLLDNKKMYPNLKINEKNFCEGYVERRFSW